MTLIYKYINKNGKIFDTKEDCDLSDEIIDRCKQIKNLEIEIEELKKSFDNSDSVTVVIIK